jgi:hypothetical protein
MECPRCQSRSVYRLPKHAASRKSPFLRVICFPYKCADCNARFWRIKGNLLTLALLVAAIVAVLGVAAMTINTEEATTAPEEQFKFAEE